MESFTSEDKAIKAFEKKFKDKTKNDWKNREKFVPYSGKYTLIEMDAGGEDEEEDKSVVIDVSSCIFLVFIFI